MENLQTLLGRVRHDKDMPALSMQQIQRPLLFPARQTSEIIIGYRWWRVICEFTVKPIQFNLLSVYRMAIWEHGKPMIGDAIELGTKSGVYAYNDVTYKLSNPITLDYCSMLVTNPFFVFPALVKGEVSLWGKVICAEYGYKAQFAYPRKLIVPKNISHTRTALVSLPSPSDLAASLRRTYGIEVDEVDIET